MAKVIILKTNKGTKILGATQCSNGAYWDAEGCFKYCNLGNSDFYNKHQASKLLSIATDLGNECSNKDEWWKSRDNFIDLEINFETTQTYK